MNAIDIDDLNHSYRARPVLRGLSLQVPVGCIYGFLGRNGAGKSTCIRILAGLLARSGGSVRVLGADPSLGERAILERVGYVGESGIVPGQMTVARLIAWTSALYPRWDGELVARWLRRFRIESKQRVHRLSLGQQRQVAFLLAIASRPELLILDEPAANLDPVARRGFLDEIAGLAREQGTTVFFSTHVLGDVERVADRVGILADGMLQVDESLDELKETVRQVRFYWEKAAPPPVQPPGAWRVRQGRGETLVTMRIADEKEVESLARQSGCQWELRGLNLEDLFVELTQDEIL
jgi:ABC-2 type transport system ATP-binding protein